MRRLKDFHEMFGKTEDVSVALHAGSITRLMRRLQLRFEFCF